LNAALKKSDAERMRFQRQVSELQRQLSDAQATVTTPQVVEVARPAEPKPLQVLLAQGEGAPPLVKEMRLEVRGSRELREKLFAVESELEEKTRELEVDKAAELKKERHKNTVLQKALDEKECAVADLEFDLRRARGTAAGDRWAQQEEEYMRLNLQVRQLEEEIGARKKTEAELQDRLLDQEHQAMDLRFDCEQSRTKSKRLENRIMELTLQADVPDPVSSPPPATIAAASRKEKGLEHVVEGLERVVAQLRAENRKLKGEAEGRKGERRLKSEADRLRKRVEDLEAELAHKAQDGVKMHEDIRGKEVLALQAELEVKRRRVVELEEELREHAIHGAQRVAAADVPAQLRELRAARDADAAALDEAQQALHEAELTERRYLEVAQENKRLKAELNSLQDQGFWQDLEAMHTRNQESMGLLRESKQALTAILAAFPSIEPPASLLVRMDRCMAAVAA